MSTKYRLPSWKAGYYITFTEGGWINESGTPIQVCNYSLDQFVKAFDATTLPKEGSILKRKVKDLK